ncbi:LuxR C-terminal-related transcriptional regulator [Gracilimonas sp. Q87]|uniref:LuxR C-terminal-related transcriptional regulator n=1 Tax=Gracilimonas sp. Q87 TaxID=3384766 RepID=UPI003983FD41
MPSLAFQELPVKGVPYLNNFPPSQYGHKGKIWDIDTAPNGMVYMASNRGLLEYDGRHWKSYNGSRGITRSVTVINDSLIYSGSDLDFGVWKRNLYKEFEYTSLYPFREDLNQISEEFWNVHAIDDNIFFVSASNIYVYTNGSLTKIPAPNEIQKSFELSGTLYFVDEINGLYELQDLSPKLLTVLNFNPVPEIVGMYENEDRLILVSQNSGLYKYELGEVKPLDTELSRILREANVFSFEKIGDTNKAFGTILRGLYISDEEGNITHHVNKNKGLQNNTVLSLHYSPKGKLWMGMDYGISYLDLMHKFTFFYDFHGDFGTGYTAVLRGKDFYLGTNQGLYTATWDELNDSHEDFDNFRLIPGSEGQVWSLNIIEDEVWVGHDRGLFTLKGGILNRIGEQSGIWTIKTYKNYLLAGTYNGISIFRKRNGEWVFWKKMDLIIGSCNQIIIDGENTIWINIPTFGVIKATLGDDLEPIYRDIYSSEEFEGSRHSLLKTDEGIQVTTGNYRYLFDPTDNSFKEPVKSEPNSALEDLLRENALPRSLTSDYDFYPIYNGFALRNLTISNENINNSYQLVFRSFEAFNNNDVFQTYQGANISYKYNNVRIEALIPNEESIRYQYKSERSEKWVDNEEGNSFNLIGLSHGNHTVTVRAIMGDTVVAERSASFKVSTPWFLSWYAYLIYLMLVVVLIWVIYYWQDISLKKQKKYLLTDKRSSLQQQEEKYRQRLKTAEKARLKAEIEQVKEQLKAKTIELATKAKENDEKNKILSSLNQKLESIEKKPETLKRKLSEMKRIIDTHSNSDDNTFEIQIDQLHQKFYETLRREFPELTRYDLRLCAYIKIGFDSKEIADLLNIKPSSVYISRSRLRKKLNIETDEDLHGYLNSI